MEKRRNTLDRWQRLRFGRRSASNPPEDKKPSTPSDTEPKRLSDKTERLKELTELLKGSRSPVLPSTLFAQSHPGVSNTPPPIPPPRKPRHPLSSNSSSVEKYIDSSPSESNSPICNERSQSFPNADASAAASGGSTGNIFHLPSFIQSNRPNSSAGNLEPTRNTRSPPLAEAEDHNVLHGGDSGQDDVALSRAESRTIVGSYTQKTIPFRSASFSHVDYSSGKYIRSALGALKASISINKTHSVVDNANLTLPRKKDGSRSTSPSLVTSDVGIEPLGIDLGDLGKCLETPSQFTEKRNARLLSDLNLNLTAVGAPTGEAQQQRRRLPQTPGSSNANVIIEEDNEGSPTVDAKAIVYASSDRDQHQIAPLQLVQASEQVLDFLSHEELALQSPDAAFRSEEYLQTATQCLIPVPVYECVVRDWNDTDLADQWINACEVDSSKIVDYVSDKVDREGAGVVRVPRRVREQVIAEVIEASESELPSTVQEQNSPDGSPERQTSLTTGADNEKDIDIIGPAKQQNAKLSDNVLSDKFEERPHFDERQHKSSIEEIKQIESSAENRFSLNFEMTSLSDTPDNLIESSNLNEEPALKNTQNLTLELEDVPAISVTPGSSCGSSFEDVGNTQTRDSDQNLQPEYVVEVRKRHSNDGRHSDKGSGDNSRSGSGSGANSPKSNVDEKRRIDKSKRRKGIYIQWAAIEQHHQDLVPWDDSSRENTAGTLDDESAGGNPLWPDEPTPKEAVGSLESESDIDLRTCDFAAISSTVAKKLEKIDSSGGLWLKCQSPDDIRTPGTGSLCGSFEPTTPESEYSRPMWPKIGGASIRRQSLSLQSSEEKDDSPTNSSPSSKPHHKLFVLRSDSISDNEMSDRTPPSRDRASQSPAPGEQDLKRYSKRPLRGPYGQMLEAEMKKPAKTNYDGLLEELNRSERYVENWGLLNIFIFLNFIKFSSNFH